MGKVALVTSLGLISVFSFLSAIHCAWLTATPLTPDRLRIVQLEFFLWLSAFVLSLFTAGVLIIRALRARHAKRSSQITSAI